MTLVREFNLYLTAGRTIPLVINVNQFDSGEQWAFTIYKEDGTQYIPSTGAIVGIKSDNLGIINSGTVDENGRVIITETQQMTASVGKAVFELTLDSGTHGTANFVVLVEEKPGNNADLSDSDISLIQEALNAVSPLPTGGTVGQVLTKTAQGSAWSDAGTPTQEQVAEAVSDWADENITVETGVVIDQSLSVSGAAADAKKTGDEISDLKSAINEINPTEELTGWVDGKYIGTSSSTANPSSPTADNNYRYLLATATEGESFIINATGGSTPRTWAFIDSSNNVLTPKAIANVTCKDYVIVAPADSAYLIINDKKTGGKCYRGIGIRTEISDLEATGDIANAVANAKANILISSATWESGQISNLNGQKSSNASRICTPNFIDITGLSNIAYSIDSGSIGLKIAYYSEKSEDSWVESDPEWLYGCGITQTKGNYVRLTLSTGTVSNSSLLSAIAFNPIVDGFFRSNIVNELCGIAHMGNTGNAYNDPPANSKPNYINASKKGYKYVEGDIQITSDGVVVLNHDDDISSSYTWYYAGTDNRVTTEVLISNTTYADLYANYDVRRSAGNIVTKVLTFEEWIVLCRNLNLYPFIDLKPNVEYTGAIIKKLVDITKKYGMQNDCGWFAKEVEQLEMILQFNPSANVGYDSSNDSDPTKIATTASLKTPFNNVWAQYRYTNITNTIIEDAKSYNVPIIVWTVDTEADMLALDDYISGVLSNTLNYADVKKNALYAELSE